jgi:hypothetical protein
MARAAVPLGFMPDPARLAGGVLDIVICSAGGIATVTVDAAGTPVTHPRTDPGPVHDGLCPFAAAAALALAAVAVVLSGMFRWPERLDSTISGADLASARILGALGPRAPPLP